MTALALPSIGSNDYAVIDNGNFLGDAARPIFTGA